jgi:hypothetical protein
VKEEAWKGSRAAAGARRQEDGLCRPPRRSPTPLQNSRSTDRLLPRVIMHG